MEFGVGFFNEGYPKFLQVSVVAIQRSFIFSAGDPCVNNLELPLSVFKELEHCKTLCNTIVVD